MTTAFQANAFQINAFQVDIAASSMWWSRRKVRLQRFYSWPAEPKPKAEIEAKTPATVAQIIVEHYRDPERTIPAPTLPQPSTGLLRAEKRISETLRMMDAVQSAQDLRRAIRENRKARADYAAMLAMLDDEEAFVVLMQ